MLSHRHKINNGEEANWMPFSEAKIKRVLKEQQFQKDHYPKFNSLTKREKEILSLLGEGLNNPQIASKLYISRYTVEQHRKNINRKLCIKSLADIITYAHAFDLI